ncbi:signal peptidase I [Anaerocolumna aminovalerica]|jgi:signal peptidase I|uniref:signal peptidase I n=1 Tax=Anaerocolumna aminovalerica TaxID=1527 RepID=UPI003AB969A2
MVLKEDQMDVEQTDEEIKRKKIRGIVMEAIIYVAILFICIFIVPKYIMQRTIVDGPSMENTLHNGENVLVGKISPRIGNLDRFNIIVFYPYGRDINEYYVKRIIGMPGETIQIVGSDIYINGEILKEDYGKDPITKAGIAAEPIILAEDEYFVMGDNREISEDSRSIGPVLKENISGKVILRIWPLNKFGLVD